MMIVVGYILSISIGLRLSLIGTGGGILAIPILVYVMGLSPAAATPLSLMIVICISLVSVVSHMQLRQVDWSQLWRLMPVFVLSIPSNLYLCHLLSDSMRMIAFSLLASVSAILMLRRSHKHVDETIHTDTPINPIQYYGFATLISLICGVIGIGGGFAWIPFLVKVARLPMKTAIGTSLCLIVLNCSANLFSFMQGQIIRWDIGIGMFLMALVGVGAGMYISKYLKSNDLQKIFAYTVLGIPVYGLIQYVFVI